MPDSNQDLYPFYRNYLKLIEYQYSQDGEDSFQSEVLYTRPEHTPQQRDIPVVRIQDGWFVHCPMKNQSNLSERILDYILSVFPIPPETIQLDYDYRGAQDLDNYRLFVQNISALAKKYGIPHISCTSRLRDYEANQNAPIPGDQQLLMLYNLSDARDMSRNYIYDSVTAEIYLQNAQWPDELRIGLPYYHQARVFRNGNFVRFLNRQSPESLQAQQALMFSGNNHYYLTQNLLLEEEWLQKGDEIIYDEADAQAIYRQFRKHYSGRVVEVVLFRWDENDAEKFSKRMLEDFF